MDAAVDNELLRYSPEVQAAEGHGLACQKNLRESAEDSEVRTLARARTLTVLERMDPSRKRAVMQFLVKAELIQKADGRGPISSGLTVPT
jgi:hypothetical protein